MNARLFYTAAAVMLALFSAGAFADSRWSNYQGADAKRPPAVNRPNYPQHGPNYPQHYPNYPQHYPNYPHRPPYPNRPYPPVQNGVSIHYQAPTTIIQNSQSYSWVNGDPAHASISSSTYMVITDWRRLGLPPPPQDMYWIMENGRYILVPNR